MSKLEVGLGERSYSITIEQGCLEKIGSEIGSVHPASRYCIISDNNIAEIYGKRLLQVIESTGVSCDLLIFPQGEEHKNLATVGSLLSQAAQIGLDRKSMFIALGGGVSGDIAGFVAATYMRGVPFIQIPTSLLAQVDSSVGGKTGVDIPEGKNLVGAFYQPEAVYIDPGKNPTATGRFGDHLGRLRVAHRKAGEQMQIEAVRRKESQDKGQDYCHRG